MVLLQQKNILKKLVRQYKKMDKEIHSYADADDVIQLRTAIKKLEDAKKTIYTTYLNEARSSAIPKSFDSIIMDIDNL